MKACRRHSRLALWGAALLAIGCAHKITVEIPPRIDLSAYQTIGILEFTSNSTEKLNQSATQRFINAIQRAQSQVRFLELGAQDKVLRAVGHPQLDPEAMKAIGKKYGVSTIFTGHYDISTVKPKVSLGTDLTSVKASANVNVSLISKQWDTATGATVWTNARYGNWPVANVDKPSGGAVSFSLSVPEEQYERFIGQLVYGVTNDFRPHYERRKAPKA